MTWRKNMQRFYQQYSSDGRYRGHATGEVGDRLEPRLKSVGIGHITLFPALPSDDGLYQCEVTRVSDESVGTEVLRKSFGVSVGRWRSCADTQGTVHDCFPIETDAKSQSGDSTLCAKLRFGFNKTTMYPLKMYPVKTTGTLFV